MRGLLALLLLCTAAACQSRPEVPILTWHIVASSAAEAAGDSWVVSPDRFEEQLDALVAADFDTISLGTLLDARAGKVALPKNPVVLTFDDGTVDHFETVLPLLQRRELTATFFLISGRLGDDEAHRVALGGHRYLLKSEARALLAAGMEIGAHTRTHPHLKQLADQRAREEIERSKAELESDLGSPVDVFAYPYNALWGVHAQMVADAGFRGAVAGVVHGSRDRLSLFRVPVDEGTDVVELCAQIGAHHPLPPRHPHAR